MGKVEDLRAMREARYAAATRTLKVASPPTKPATAGPTAKPATSKKAGLRVVHEVETVEVPQSPGTEPAALFAVLSGPDVDAEPEVDLCGHRAISGKTCIRENKHAEKNHKYAKS